MELNYIKNKGDNYPNNPSEFLHYILLLCWLLRSLTSTVCIVSGPDNQLRDH